MTRLLRLSLIALCLFAVACATGGAPKSVDTQTPVDTTGVVDTQVSIDTSPSLDSDPSVDLEPPNDEISPPDVAPDGSVPLTTSVATVQNTQASTVCPPVGTSTDPQFQTFGNVTLVNVVVIGLPHYAGTGYERIYVADPGGGPRSPLSKPCLGCRRL